MQRFHKGTYCPHAASAGMVTGNDTVEGRGPIMRLVLSLAAHHGLSWELNLSTLESSARMSSALRQLLATATDAAPPALIPT